MAGTCLGVPNLPSISGAQAPVAIFWLKNHRKDRWRDVQNVEADIGHYILSDRPMSEEEWIMQRTVFEQKRAPKQIDSLAEDEQKPQE